MVCVISEIYKIEPIFSLILSDCLLQICIGAVFLKYIPKP